MSTATSPDDFVLHQTLAGAWYLEGPADYMNARGIEMMNAILEGRDQLLDQLMLRHRDWVKAVLVRLRADYADWKNVSQIIEMMTGQPSPEAHVCATSAQTTDVRGSERVRDRQPMTAQLPLWQGEVRHD